MISDKDALRATELEIEMIESAYRKNMATSGVWVVGGFIGSFFFPPAFVAVVIGLCCVAGYTFMRNSDLKRAHLKLR